MPIRALLPAALALILVAASPAAAAEYVPGEVIVKYRDGTTGTVQADLEEAAGTEEQQALAGGSAQLEIEDGESVGATVAELRQDPNVAYAVPNFIAHAAAPLFPNDPGFPLQWNFNGPFSINMPDAWELAPRAGAARSWPCSTPAWPTATFAAATAASPTCATSCAGATSWTATATRST
jgi:hypothetical protein